MVRGISTCFFCGESDLWDPVGHIHKQSHKEAVRRLLTNRGLFHKLVNSMRPDGDTILTISECCTALQQAMRPASMHITGSIGKSTALRGEHDMDVVLVIPGGANDTNMWRIQESLQTHGFEDVYLQMRNQDGRRLVTARFDGLDVDILPVASLEGDGWAASAVRNAESFRKALTAVDKDVVRVLKAAFRLRFPNMPGVLLETVVCSLDASPNEDVHSVFNKALRELACFARCLCPLTGRDLVQDRKDHDEVMRYAAQLSALSASPGLGPSFVIVHARIVKVIQVNEGKRLACFGGAEHPVEDARTNPTDGPGGPSILAVALSALAALLLAYLRHG